MSVLNSHGCQLITLICIQYLANGGRFLNNISFHLELISGRSISLDYKVLNIWRILCEKSAMLIKKLQNGSNPGA